MRYISGRGFVNSYNLGPCPSVDTKEAARIRLSIRVRTYSQSANWPRKALDNPADQAAWTGVRRASRVREKSIGLKSSKFTNIYSSHKAPPGRLQTPEDIRLSPKTLFSSNQRSEVRQPSTSVDAQKMHSYIEFLSTPTADTPGTALSLHFDDKRYIIGNIHEGTQRAIVERGQRLLKVSDIFLTGKTEWKNTGGLVGMILTLADASTQAAISAAEQLNKKQIRKSGGENGTREENKQSLRSVKRRKAVALAQPSLTIHGGPNITHTLATTRHFVFRHGMPVDVDEYIEGDRNVGSDQDWAPTWVDPRVQVWAMAISPSVNEQAPAASSPKSPNKRSFAEFVERETPMPTKSRNIGDSSKTMPIAQETQERQDQKLRGSVVAEMFNSAWRSDNLVETQLCDVQMPAALFVRNQELNKLERYTGPVPDGITPLPNITVMVRKPWPGAMIEDLPSTKPSSTSMSYIFRNHRQRGTFLRAKAIELRVEEGPLWSQLASGHNVQSMDGLTIEPGMVLEEGREGAGVAVIDLPSADYVDNLVNRPEWKVDRIMTGVGAIIWLLGPEVGRNQTLRNFMNERSDLKHVISSPDYCPNYLSMESSAAVAIRLNQVDPSHYAIPVHDNTNLPRPEQPIDEASPPVDYIQAQRGLIINTGPLFQVQGTDSVPNLDPAVVLKETPEDVLELAKTAREEIDSQSMAIGASEKCLPSQDAEIICLGTGSALPSKYRNVSATLLRVPGYGSYLLDCGENTIGQLRRIFPPQELAEILRDLKLIWISHLHADHHLGTASVIKAWYEEVHGQQGSTNRTSSIQPSQHLQDPIQNLYQGKHLFVASHSSMLRWLQEYSSVENYGYEQIVPLNCWPGGSSNTSYSRIKCNGHDMSFHPDNQEMRKAMTAATGLSNLVTCGVTHCHGAMAVALTFPNGFKVSYSGDCRPSKPFAQIGKNSTVLIHEATFDDELQGDAEAKKHSTTSEAIGVAVAMRAKRVILTHFSQRYQKIPNMAGLANAEVKLEDTEEVQDMMDAADEAVESADAIIAAAESMDFHSCTDKETDLKDSEDSISSVVRLSADQQAIQDMKIGVAFDYMRVKVGEIAQLEKFSPALIKLLEKPVLSDAESLPATESKGTSEKAAKRKKNKKAFEAAQKQHLTRVENGEDGHRADDSPENRPWGRNAERAERDRAVFAATEARNLEAARRAETAEESGKGGSQTSEMIVEPASSAEPVRAGAAQ